MSLEKNISEEQELIELLKAAIDKHTALADSNEREAAGYDQMAQQHRFTASEHRVKTVKFKAMLEALYEDIDATSEREDTSESLGGRPKIVDVIRGLLDDGIPRTSRELLDMFNKHTGKIHTLTDFSGRLSRFVSKTDAKIARHIVPSNPTSMRHYYGKSEWFDEHGKLKSEYEEKIKKQNDDNPDTTTFDFF